VCGQEAHGKTTNLAVSPPRALAVVPVWGIAIRCGPAPYSRTPFPSTSELCSYALQVVQLRTQAVPLTCGGSVTLT
jgi:hypothetical protein